MNTRIIELTRGRKVEVAESGQGSPLVYLHGFVDVHGASVGWLPMHEQLSRSFRLIAPAHPGCAGSDENEDIETIDDVEFHLLEVLDALGLGKVDVAGNCFGGWLAAELAARNPERVNRLVLIGASGLYVPGEPIGDLFWEVQAQNGVEYRGLRALLFAEGESDLARSMLPDGRADVAREMSRYKVMRYASRVGFKPPYFYHRTLRDRLHRFPGEVLLVWGGADRMVPLAHARAYEQAFNRSRSHVIAQAGHAVIIEQPEAAATAIRSFLSSATVNAHRRVAPKRSVRSGAKKAGAPVPSHGASVRTRVVTDKSHGAGKRPVKRAGVDATKRSTKRAAKRVAERPAKRPARKRRR